MISVYRGCKPVYNLVSFILYRASFSWGLNAILNNIQTSFTITFLEDTMARYGVLSSLGH